MSAPLEEALSLQGPRGTLRGLRHAPLGDDRGWTALVLHGYFSCTHVGPARLYVQLGRRFAARGLELWRVGTHGVGDSDGDFTETSLAGQLADYRAMLARIPPGRRVCLVGHSLGAYLALRLACEEPRLGRLLLLSPACGPLAPTSRLFSPEEAATLAAEGRLERKGTVLQQAFLDEQLSPRFLDELRARLPRSLELTVVCGAEDEHFPPDFSRQLVALVPHARLVELPGGDHNFQRPGTRAAALAAVEAQLDGWAWP